VGIFGLLLACLSYSLCALHTGSGSVGVICLGSCSFFSFGCLCPAALGIRRVCPDRIRLGGILFTDSRIHLLCQIVAFACLLADYRPVDDRSVGCLPSCSEVGASPYPCEQVLVSK
jgi:hypothetical protein